MIGSTQFFLRVTALTLLCGILSVRVYAEELTDGPLPVSAVQPAVQSKEKAEPEESVISEPQSEARKEVSTLINGFAGYRFLRVDPYGGRAAPYEYLRSSPLFGGAYNSLDQDLKFALEGQYLNDKDYYGDLLTDYRGEYRLHLRTESLYHNLDHEQLGQNFTLAATPYVFRDLDPAGQYGVRVEQDQAAFRYKLHNYPLHVNLGYWRLFREGTEQLRFADALFEYSGANTISAVGRRVNQETHEGTAGFDVHLGVVDVIYNFKIREFFDREAIPRDFYTGRTSYDPDDPSLPGGFLQHNENPDSSFYSHTVKLHTSLSGGIVGAASYTYGQRVNRSSLSDFAGAAQTHATLQNAAGDFVYTPCKEFSLALKYRRQEVDQESPATLASQFDASVVNVRQPLATEKDSLTATFSVHASERLTFKGEYQGDFLRRDNVAFWDRPIANVSQDLPGNSFTNTGTLSVLARPLKGLLLEARYGYRAVDNPSYGTDFAERHEGWLFASYNSPNRWGVTANCRVARESNDQLERSTLPQQVVIPPNTYNYIQIDNPISRSRDTDSATASIWVAPFDGFALNASYSFLRARIDQGVLFESMALASPAALDATNYTTQAQIYLLSADYQLTEKLDLSATVQQVRSFSDFAPDLTSFPQGGDTSGIEAITRTETVESSLSARAEYQLLRHLSCTLDYSYRDYAEKSPGLFNGALFNGTVQAVMAYVSTKW